MGVGRLYDDEPSRKLNLPYDIPANEFMNLEGRNISGSRNWAVWMDDALDRYLCRQAGQDIRKHVCATYVLMEDETPSVIGFYTLAATSVRLHDLR